MPIHFHLLYQFSVTSPSSFFPTTILWIHFVKMPTEHVSNISLAMIESTWMSESSVLLLLEAKFLTSKLCNTLWTKINAWAYVAYFCNYLFYFYLFNFFFFLLTFWLWKSLTYMLFMWGSMFHQRQHFWHLRF